MKAIHNFKKKYKECSSAIKASVWFAICSILQKGIQFITVPIFTRLMTTNQYGQYSMYQAWYSIISIFATLNLSAGVFNNAMVRYTDDKDGFTSAVQGLSSTVTIIIFFLYLTFKSFWNKVFNLPTSVMICIFMDLIFYTAVLFWTARQRFDFKYKNIVIVTMITSILNPILGIIFVRFSQDKGVMRIVSATIINVIVGVCIYCFNVIKGKKLYFKKYWIYSLKFNIPLIPHYLSFVILNQCDRVMIEKMFGVDKTAIYSVAASISMVMSIIVNSINSSYTPWVYQCCEQKENKKIMRTTNVLIVLVAVVAVVPVLIAPELLKFIGPVEYQEAIWVIPPITTSVFFTFIYCIFGNIEFYYGENIYVMIASTLAAICNIIFNYCFMKVFGYIAAGYTTMLCYMIMAYAHYIFMKKICKKNNLKGNIFDEKIILVISVLYILITGLIMLLFKMIIVRYVLIILIVILILIKKNSIKKLIKR